MSTNLTDSIVITAKSTYLAQQSEPNAARFVFGYTITIENQGSTTSQLLTRHWLITDANGGVQEVHGDGVIGEQPLLPPGGSHTYSSGAVLKTPVGTMEGTYGMRTSEGETFEARIPVFRLANPEVLN